MSVLRCGLCSTLTEEVVQILKENRLKSVTDIISSDLEAVSQETRIPYKDLVGIVSVLVAQYSAYPVAGDSLYNYVLTSTSILPTSCQRLDQLLDGGLYTGEVTEIAGEIASGKTQHQLKHQFLYRATSVDILVCSCLHQICLSVAASVICHSKQNVLYIDTCGGFSAERLEEILHTRYNYKTKENLLSHIKCVQAFDVYNLMSELQLIKASVIQQVDPFYSSLKLVIVDSVTAVIYPILGGNQIDGHGLIVQLSQLLRLLAVDFSLSVLISNNIVVNEGEKRASLGRVWSHVPHTRLMVSRHMDQQGNIQLAKSSRMKIGQSVNFDITEKGCVDPG